METIIIESPNSTTTQKIKDFLKELNVKYKTGNTSLRNNKGQEKSYDPDFVNMVLEASNEEGGKIIDPKNIWDSIKS